MMLPRVLALSVVLIACDKTPPSSPVFPDLDDAPGAIAWAKAAQGGYFRNCAATMAGAAYCWGSFDCSPAGCVYATKPAAVPGGNAFVDITTGSSVSCGRTLAGDVWCWGSVYPSATEPNTDVPVKLPLGEPASSVAAGDSQFCVAVISGSVKCWRFLYLAPSTFSGSLPFTKVTVGGGQVCATDSNADAYCWGFGYGLGMQDSTCTPSSCFQFRATPTLVDGGHKWLSIDAGSYVTCGVTTDLAGYCWGGMVTGFTQTYTNGLLGDGHLGGSSTPMAVFGSHQFVQISVGLNHACGITVERAAYCWGSNSEGELGIGGSSTLFNTPQPVIGGLKFSAITADAVTCGVSMGQNLYCWGPAYDGLLGDGDNVINFAPVPVRVSNPTP